MKAVTIYEASDGQRFSSEKACAAYEELAVAVAEAMRPMPLPPRLPHGRWIQRDREVCLGVKRRLVEIARTIWPNEPVWQHYPDDIHPMSFAGRLASEGPDCFARAWTRIGAINWESFREYDQPFFAMNPDKAEGELAAA